ncbi:MAG: Na/Pi cotransporter family protein [Clostridiales bacterium]|nr:Na/Pi cotransporter family protein [Clostridiales bacterium]
MNSTVEIIFGLFGGLAIFIFGMNEMSSGLKKIAGDRLRKILKVLTGNPIVGILMGVLVTALMQSSSATTVMVIGFVAARLITLPQAIAVILGANIGTTVTAQLVAFKIGAYAYPITAIGFVLMFFFKKKSIKNFGQTIFAFGLLFVGLNLMGDVMKPLAQSQQFADLMVHIHDVPILGLLVSTGMTLIVQSSSATIAVLQKLAIAPGPDGANLIPLALALPFLFGSNIGTTITAIFASVGAGISARRAAFAHAIFNILGSILFMFLITPFSRFILWITPDTANVSRQIANAHTIFNVINTLLWLPFIKYLAKFVQLVIPGQDTVIENRPLYLDIKMLSSPSIAMNLVTKELVRMAELSTQMMDTAEKAFIESDMIAIKKVHEIEEVVDMLQHEIVHYLSKLLASEQLTENQSIRLTGLLHIVSDIERIGDYCDNIADSAEVRIDKKLPFTDNGIKELIEAFELVTDMVAVTVNALQQYDDTIAKNVISREYLVDEMERTLREAHIERLNKAQCHPHSGLIFIELIHNLERIGDHCKNIAEAILNDVEAVPAKISEATPS